MTIPQVKSVNADDEVVNGWWSADIDVSRTPSPGIPAKRLRSSLEQITEDFHEQQWRETTDNENTNLFRAQMSPQTLGYGSVESYKELWFSPSGSVENADGKKSMQTGCIPCLYVHNIYVEDWSKC